MWSMVVQRLTQITSSAATPDQIWQRVEAAWSVVPKNISKVSLNQCRGVWQRILAHHGVRILDCSGFLPRPGLPWTAEEVQASGGPSGSGRSNHHLGVLAVELVFLINIWRH
ncbi:hypothetical protein LAZ67_9000277 [Cordylochernes scorpioides]|uniref:Transposase n=1 Tax=Cordylochernes scorpioides TaxID=51811 RepID=A0ABY6KSC6_9ARAC|nr:hypothetical protein LAZ67_9000277 [Cordylochernes scorpioides]